MLVDGVDDVDGLNGARGVAVSSDGKQVYVTGEDDDALAIFSREEVNGSLVFVEARFDGVDGVDGIDQAYSVLVVREGSQIYVAGLGDNAVAAFARSLGVALHGRRRRQHRRHDRHRGLRPGDLHGASDRRSGGDRHPGQHRDRRGIGWRRGSERPSGPGWPARDRRLPRQRRRSQQRFLHRRRHHRPARRPRGAQDRRHRRRHPRRGADLHADRLQSRPEQHRRRHGRGRPLGHLPGRRDLDLRRRRLRARSPSSIRSARAMPSCPAPGPSRVSTAPRTSPSRPTASTSTRRAWRATRSRSSRSTR